jgi:hypothetical protein
VFEKQIRYKGHTLTSFLDIIEGDSDMPLSSPIGSGPGTEARNVLSNHRLSSPYSSISTFTLAYIPPNRGLAQTLSAAILTQTRQNRAEAMHRGSRTALSRRLPISMQTLHRATVLLIRGRDGACDSICRFLIVVAAACGVEVGVRS